MSAGSQIQKTKEKLFLRCVVCGQHAFPSQFIRGALGHRPEAISKSWKKGQHGVIWNRRPFTRDEFVLIANAVTKATEIVEDYSSDDSLDLAEVFAALNHDDASALGSEWIEEAVNELKRRQQIVELDEERRRDG